MRIIQYGPTRWRGGVATSIRDLSNGLADCGHEVLLLGNGGEVLQDLRCEQMLVEEGLAFRNVLAVRKAINAFKPDIVHVHGRGPALNTWLAGRGADVFTLHNTSLTSRVNFLDRGVMRKIAPLARSIVVLNNEAESNARAIFGTSDVTLILNGVNCSRFRPPTKAERKLARERWNIGQDDTLAVFVGRLHDQKNPQAVLELARQVPEVRFVLVGEGDLEPVLRRDLPSNVSLVGWSDPKQAYWAADIVVMPSRYEGCALVALEALASGCPVLMTKTGGWSEIIRDEISGYAVDQQDFIVRGKQILNNPLSTSREECRRLALSELSIERQVERTLAVYGRARAR